MVAGALVAVPSFSSAATLAADRANTVTYDLGASTGRSNDKTYTEVNLGLSWYPANWFAWRNAAFARFLEGADTGYGLDTSFRLIADLGSPQMGLSAFVAPGYRFSASGVASAPFAEEGVTFRVGGLRIGGGAKQIFHSLIHPGESDDNQYFVVLGGGGML